MIYATVNLTVGDYTSTCDKKIILYRGDRNVEIRFAIKDNKFTVLDSTYAQMIIKRPSATSVFSEPALIQNDTVVLTVTGDMIDELREIGEYTFQIRLYDTNMNARATLPPCNSCLIIERPIATEGESIVNSAAINDSVVMPAGIGEEEIFDEDEEYIKTNWVDGDLITDVRLNKIENALYLINQKKGNSTSGGATAPYISTALSENVLVETGETFNLHLDFNSPNPGMGTLKVFINDVESVSVRLSQGESTTPIDSSLFEKGTNKLIVYVLDRVGVMSNSLTFYIRYGSTEIVSDFDAYSAYEYGAPIRYYFTPTALDTSIQLTFYMSIDGQVQQGVSCQSDTRGYYTFPTNLTPDSHYCEAYVIDGNGLKSNVLSFNLVILRDDTIVVASDTKSKTIEEGEQLSLDYRVYMNDNSSFITKTYINGVLVNTGTCGLDFNYYRTSSLTEGVYSIKIEVYDLTETHSDYIIWTITVSASAFETIQPVNAGAMFIASAVNKTNTDERRGEFIGKDETSKEIIGMLHNFAFNSESGWVNDELIISGNSHVEIPIQPLSNNARYGFTLELEFTSRQIGVEDAEVLTLWNEEKDCGIRITTEDLILRSAEGNECRLYYSDNERTNVMFIIDRQERKAKIYLNGVMCEAFHLNDYTAEGVSYLEDFTVNSNLFLGGYNKNGYSKIRNLRIYNLALTTNEIINNWISCELSKSTQRQLVEFQKGETLPTTYVYCDFSGLGKDDKKPCKVTYVSTDEEKYGPSFTLDHKKSTLQYQGTSSMAYPIKNYRLNLADEDGNKWRYEFPFGQPEFRYTFKADFMNSCHAHNTGMAKFINDNLYHYNLNDPKTINPLLWYRIQNGIDISNFREAIYGFPCRLILVNDGNTPLNVGQNEPTPGNTKDMGIFNFNHDKDATKTLGFDSDLFPNCASYEVTANSDTSAGAFMSFKGEKNAFDYRIQSSVYNRTLLVPIDANNLRDITVNVAHALYLYKEDKTWFNNIINQPANTTNTIPADAYYVGIAYENEHTSIIVNGIAYQAVNQLDVGETEVKDFYYLASESDSDAELDYIKQSFELRYPDADDVPEGWGFMGVETPCLVIDKYTAYNDRYTSKISVDYFQTKTLTLNTHTGKAFSIRTYGSDGSTPTTALYGVVDGGEVTIPDDAYYILITTSFDWEKIDINGVEYKIGDTYSDVMADVVPCRDPYESTGFDSSYGLKALIDWVDNCTDEEFVRDFEQHFHKDYTLRYYAFVVLIGAVDNLGKNMMLDTADNKIFFPRFYDIDTILSYDNSGDIKFDVDIEMEQGYWNTSSSRLWTRIRELMHDDIVATYNDMRQNGVSYENIMKYMYDEQIAKIPQTYYNKDYDVKYAPFEDSYIGMAHGNGYEHMKRWLKNRFTFCDTLFDYAPAYNNDMLTIRANTTELMNIEIETYTPVYQHVSWYNGQMDKKKIDGKTGVQFSGTAQAATDQEVLIYGGSNVKRIKGLSSMNPNQMLIGSATRLIELDAEGCPLLADINSNKANLSPHTYLNKVNLKDCPLLGGNLRLNNSPLLQEVDVRGTAITGLNLPSSIRNLEILRLPNAITDLTLNDASMLHTLEFDEGVKMNSVSMSNCNMLTNVINFDLLQSLNVTLDNSYNTVAELYFRDTTNLTVRNMPKLERIIYIPNNEYEVFDMSRVANAPNYSITTFNCPKLSTFMTTAPYRESYNNGEYGSVNPNTTFAVNTLDIANTQFTDVKLLCTTDVGTLKLPATVKNFYCDSSFDLDTNYLEDGEYDIIHGELIEQYTTDYGGVVKYGKPTYMEFYINGIVSNLSILIDGRTFNPTTGIEVSSGDWVLTDFIEVPLNSSVIAHLSGGTDTSASYRVAFYDNTKVFIRAEQYGSNTTVETNIPSDANFVKISFRKSGIKDLSVGIPELIIPNVIPSSADGSLIFNMYTPSKTIAPGNGTWDLNGLSFDNFHTFGMNNDIKSEYGIKELKNNTTMYIIPDVRYGGSALYDMSKQYTAGCSISPILLDEDITSVIVTTSNGCRLLHYYSTDFNGTTATTQNFMGGNTNSGATTTVNSSRRLQLITFENDTNLEWFDFTLVGNETKTIRYYLKDMIIVNVDDERRKTWNTVSYDVVYDVTPISMTMPARYNDYNITIKNANIAPKEYNTMLYPLLVNEDNPIEGILDYTNYAGNNLSWSFAYTDLNKVTITQPKDELINTYEYKYNAFYETEYEFANPNEIARYTSSASGVLPTFNNGFTYTYEEKLNSDGTYTTKIYADSMDNLPTQISFTALLNLLTVDKLNTSKVKTLLQMFRSCGNLTRVNCALDTSSVTNEITQAFIQCSNLEYVNTEGLIGSNIMYAAGVFSGCSKLTSISTEGWDTSRLANVSDFMLNCSSLTSLDMSNCNMAKVTNMQNFVKGCTSLTTLDSMTNISVSLDLSTTSLNVASVLDIINNLATVTTEQTLTLPAVEIPESYVASAIEKGWTLAGNFTIIDTTEPDEDVVYLTDIDGNILTDIDGNILIFKGDDE